jgi:hypothetical protein
LVPQLSKLLETRKRAFVYLDTRKPDVAFKIYVNGAERRHADALPAVFVPVGCYIRGFDPQDLGDDATETVEYRLTKEPQ